MKKSERPTYSIDTSAVFDHLHGDSRQRAQVDSVVGDGTSTIRSSFVRMEHIRSRAMTFIDLYYFIKLEDSVDDAIDVFAQLTTKSGLVCGFIGKASRLAFQCGVSVDLDIRLHDFDAPELVSNPHGKADPINGPKARDALVEMLDGAAGRLWCKLTGEQTVARWEADLFVIAPDQSIHSVAAMMRAQGWDTGPSRKPPHSKDR